MLEPSLTGEATCAPRETSSTSLSSPPEPGVSVLSESPECSEHLTFPSPLFNLESAPAQSGLTFLPKGRVDAMFYMFLSLQQPPRTGELFRNGEDCPEIEKFAGSLSCRADQIL